MAEYINKSTLLKSFAPIYEHDRYTGLTFETAKQIITDHINSFPTVDAEPVRHGRWEYVDYGGLGNYHCSNCRAISRTQYNGLELIPKLSKYCPNCGAKMDLEKENETV